MSRQGSGARSARGRRAAAPSVSAALALLAGAAAAQGCRAEREPADPPAPEPVVELRYRFEPGSALRYESTTLERGEREVTIRMGTRWEVEAVERGGASAVLGVTVERYRHSVDPPGELPEEVRRLNTELAGARFRLRVTDDGRSVDHLGAERAPEVGEQMLEAIRSTLASHVLRLPERAVRVGERWTVERPVEADAGPGAASTRSLWRVLSVRTEAARRPVELVCLSTITTEPVDFRGGLVRTATEFHYDYVFDAAAGRLERLTSAGTTTIEARGVPDGGSGSSRTVFEATVRLLPGR